MTKILAIFFMWDVVLGTALLGYIWLTWIYYKNAIAFNGWNLERCTPFKPWWSSLIFYIPGVGIIYYFVTGESLGCLSKTQKTKDCQQIHVEFGNIGFTYVEDD